MFYLVSGTIVLAVVGLALFQNRVYRIPIKKLLVAATVIVVAGAMGVYALAFIEEGILGMSFFGCIFAAPIALLPTSKLLRVSMSDLTDMCGPIAGAFLALSKVNCWYQDCCLGIVIGMAVDGAYVRFPSQIIEGLNGIIICACLLLMQRNPKNRGCLGPGFLIIFGVTRFVLNSFREGLETFRLFEGTGLFIPKGHLWAAICIIWGIIWMYRARSRVYGRKLSAKEFIKSIFGLLPLKECA